ncbi:MAG: hypothetical protein WBM53_05450 [Maribacter sp.]
MTNTIQSRKDNNRFKVTPIIAIAVIVIIGFSFLFHVAYQHGDGTSYGTGYEMGRIMRNLMDKISLKNGIGVGSVIAILASWERNKSIFWAILHAIFGWFYVIYFAMTRKKQNTQIK